MRSYSTTARRLIVSASAARCSSAVAPGFRKGDPPAQYLEPAEMTETLAEVTSRLQKWPEDHGGNSSAIQSSMD